MAFRPLRRARRALPRESCEAILQAASTGVLALQGDGGYPYAVPLNFAYAGGRVYFHCAKQGHKLDAVRRCPKASLCVVDKDAVVPEKYTTAYRSVIVFGTVRVLEDPAAMHAALAALARKYAPAESEASHRAEIARYRDEVCVLELTPAHISGKQGLELLHD